MKKTLTYILLLAAMPTAAQDFQIGALQYSVISSSEKTVAVTGYESEASDGDNIYIPANSAPSRMAGNAMGYSVEIPDSVTFSSEIYSVARIEDNAFMGKYQMQSISIPAAVSSIGKTAFSGCSSLTEVTCLASSAPQVANNAFHNVDLSNCNLFVGYNSAVSYSNAEIWKDFASISQIEYLLSYHVDDELYHSEIVRVGAEIVPSEEPTKEGYTFSGWSEIPTTMPAHDVEVTGSFSVNYYLLTYLVDGEVYKTDSIAFGTEIIPSEEPTKEGYTFSGWSEIPATMPAHDVEVTGSFSVNYYLLTYLVDDEVYKTDSIAYGMEIVPSEEPTKEGYTFSGWSEIPATMPAYDVEVTGSFSVNYYLLTYIVDGDVYKTDSIAYGTEIVPSEEPTKEGYTFSGWSEIPATMPAYDVEVTGSFSVNYYLLTYLVDGEVYKTDSIAYGMEIVPSKEPTKEGYTFSGWSEIPATMPAYDVEVTGSFSANTYYIIYKVEGEEYFVDSVKYGEQIVPVEEPEREGHTFSGWQGLPEDLRMPAHDVEVTGTFVVNYYQLTYLVDGEVYQQDSVAYGTEIVLMPNPEKPGYIFSGWSGYPEDLMMPAADVTIVGSFEVDGIQRVAAGAGTDTVYDVLGRKVQNPRKGEIYLRNGKKIMIR